MQKMTWGMTLLAGCLATIFTGCGGGGGDKITLVGRQNNSGTYEYFREEVLGKEGQFRQGISAQNGSKDVVEVVSKTPSAIGYSGMGYATDQVKVLPVSKKKGEATVAPSIETARSGKYPLARKLYIFSAGNESPTAKHFIAWINSPEGQTIVADEHYVPNVTPGPDVKEDAPEGSVTMEGSDTMVQLAGKWAEVYMKKYPKAKIVVQGGGSGKGIASLIAGTTDLCNSSRDMKAEEKEKVKAKSGKDVVEHVIGLDALAIYVHKNSKLESISIEELKAVYSKDGETTTWAKLLPAAKTEKAESQSGK